MDKKRCSEEVWHNRSGFSLCAQPAKYEHEGCFCCATHYPPNVAARKAKIRAEWEAKMGRAYLEHLIVETEQAIVEAATKGDEWTADNLAVAVERLRDLKARR